jgi:hypothetical protein
MRDEHVSVELRTVDRSPTPADEPRTELVALRSNRAGPTVRAIPRRCDVGCPTRTRSRERASPLRAGPEWPGLEDVGALIHGVDTHGGRPARRRAAEGVSLEAVAAELGRIDVLVSGRATRLRVTLRTVRGRRSRSGRDRADNATST